METAKMVSSLQILGLFLLCLCLTTSSYPVHRSMLPTSFGPFIPHDYLRFDDVARQCQSVLSSAAELTVDAGRAEALADELSFANGDWHQDTGHAPLMPFHGSHAGTTEAHPGLPEVTPLATFMLAHIDTVQRQRTRTALNVSGVLSLTISRNCCCSDMAPHRHASPEFKLQPGVAKLNILFEGVYTVTSGDDGGGGQRVLCMVGNAVLPMRGGNSTDPWDWAKNVGGGSFRPPVMADSSIVLMLRYPKAHTLTARAVSGEMMSTSAKSDSAYFDKVRLVSRFGRYSSYQFRPEDEELAVTGCSTHPFFCDDDVAGNCAGGLYRGFSFCDILYEFSPHDHGVLAVVPNWKCNSIDEFCSRLGPFETGGRATNTTDRAFTGFGIAMQDVRCEPTSELDGKAAARVSAVFRAVSPWEDQRMAVKRTGLNGMTLSAEGVWRASTGQLCMVGCLGIGKEACHYRVSLYVPTTFSVTRRGIFLGQITAMDGSHFPLSFQQNVPPTQPWNRVGRSEESVLMAYNYTKVEQAGELLRRSEPSGFRGNIVATSLLSYPKRGAGTADYMTSLSHLSNDLSFHLRYVPKLQFMPDQWIEDSYFQLQILSIGSLVGSYAPPFQGGSRMPVAQNGIGQGVERQQLLNVSAAFTVSTKIFGWSTVMSLEGVYNPVDGHMYLIGCRNVHAPWRVLSKIRDLEDGMDCSIEMKVEYPPTTARWLFGPTAKVCIASTRDADDPLHFNRTELQTPPISYRGQGSDMLTEKTVEGLLCITMLSATVAAAINQLRYMKSHPNVVPYISLVMLGVQALGYGVTLVTEAQMLPAWRNYNSRFYTGHLHWGMDCSVKALTLAALLLTLRLAQKVWRSRIRARARSPLEPGRVPSDGAVLLYTFGVHLGGLLFVLVVHWLSTSGRSAPPPEVLYEAQGAVRAPTSCTRTRVERYVGLVKEWFLLPQVIGNAAWRVNCKPLGKRYYAGVTAVWLLPHVYGYLRPPVVSMYPELQDDVMDFYANVVGVVVPFIAVVLALSICVQQRWNYKIVGWAKARGQNKLQHVY